ncbi:MAG: hypothetical protein LDLANPLL_00831 [Turneriella sp.]|nr:hypothetical protein [Turneriella sp.]
MRGAIRQFFFYTQVLSLDVTFGVLGSGAFAKSVLNAKMKSVWWFLLPASVWVIYTADHLMDARKVGKNAVNARHKFHADHFTVIFFVMVCVAILCALAAIFFLPEIVLTGGIFVAAFALFHLVFAYWGKIRFGKEISVALIYSCGVWFAPFLNRRIPISTLEIFAFAFFILAALLNLFMNSVLEHHLDAEENLVFGVKHRLMEKIRLGIIILSTSSGVFLLFSMLYFAFIGGSIFYAKSSLYVSILCITPGVILYYEKYFIQDQRYRIAAEWVFMLGLFLLPTP